MTSRGRGRSVSALRCCLFPLLSEANARTASPIPFLRSNRLMESSSGPPFMKRSREGSSSEDEDQLESASESCLSDGTDTDEGREDQEGELTQSEREISDVIEDVARCTSNST